MIFIFPYSTIPRSLTHNHWHHVAITWNNTNGDWQFFIDGLKIADGRSNEGHVIKPGYLVLGQEQDRYRGGFDPSQSFNGQLGNLHMWDKVWTLITLIMNTCIERTHIKTSEDFIARYRASVKCSVPCECFAATVMSLEYLANAPFVQTEQLFS